AASFAVGDGGSEDGGEVGEEEVVLDQLPDRFEAVAAGDFQESVQRQGEPGRAQDGEPGDAVAEVHERARERIEVLHHLLLAEVLYLACAVADAGALERGGDLGEADALPHQARLRYSAPAARL